MTTIHDLPQGKALMPLDENWRADPYPILRRVQDATPCYHDEEFRRYIVTRHDDIDALLKNRAHGVNARNSNPGTFPLLLRDFTEEPLLITMDDPEHKRLRALVTRAFNVKAAEVTRPRIRKIAESLLSAIEGDELDFVTQFAGPFATAVVIDVMGIEREEDQAHFTEWTDEFMTGIFVVDATEEQKALAKEAEARLRKLFASEVAARRKSPGRGIIDDLVQSQEDGERLRDGEIVAMAIMVLIAGNITTRHTLGNGMMALLRNPEQMEKLRAKPELLPKACEEILRYDCPVQFSGRIAAYDTELGGCPVKKGEYFAASLCAANRDPRAYAEPDKFDIERADVHHQTFGGGVHYCLGAPLARVELQEAFGAVLDRYRTIALSDKGYEHVRIPNFRGLDKLWISVTR